MRTSCLTAICILLTGGYCLAQSVFTELSPWGRDARPGSSSIAVGDYDNDGYEDLYVGFPGSPNQLWKNNGDGTFTEVAAALGLALTDDANTQTAIWGDINNDGYLDLYIGNRQQPDRLFRNNGNGAFTDISREAGIQQLGYPLSVNMADVNNDGLLDIYVSNFARQNILYLNNGDDTFTDYTYASGALDEGPAMGSIFFDYDRDGDVDLYLVHDSNVPNLLYQNDGAGHFIEVGASAGVNTASFGMGVDVGDINNDDRLDIYITNLYENILLLNNGDGTFTDISATAGVDDAGMGWGIGMLDFDKDGRLDIYVANNYQFSPYPNVLYRNTGHLSFSKAEVDGPVSNRAASYGVACLDVDLDGNMDIAVANRGNNDHLQLFRNAERPGHWLGIKLIGTLSNRQAVGAQIRITDDLGRLYYDEMTAGNGWTSQHTQLFHFGLGQATSIREMIIYWPSGLIQQIDTLAVDGIYTIVEGREPREGVLYDAVTPTQETPAHDHSVQVFPNPNNGHFQVNLFCDDTSIHQLSIANSLHQLIFKRQLAPGEHSTSLNLSHLAGGQILFLNITGRDHAAVRKVILR